jgi:hypothetical protein
MIHQLQLGQFGRSVLAAGVGDQNFSSRLLLCHFDGTDGQTTTVDSSSYARALTLQGTTQPTLRTDAALFGSASVQVDTQATGRGRCTVPTSSDFAFSGQFTMEAGVYFTVAQGSSIRVIIARWGTNLSFFWGMVAGQLSFYYSFNGSSVSNFGAAWTPTLNTWYQVAVDRDASNIVRLYINGAVHATSSPISGTLFNASTTDIEIGNDGNISANGPFRGRIDEVRVSNRCEYGAAYTPATAAFPNS